MRTPKYRFYVGALSSATLLSGKTISFSSAEYALADARGRYASELIALPINGTLFFESRIIPLVNATIVFYDADKKAVYGTWLAEYASGFIEPPVSAKYFAFSTVKPEHFIYVLSEVKPIYKELSKKYAKENGQEFFRTTLEGSIKLVGQDFKVINDASIMDKLAFVVTKLKREDFTWPLYYKGLLNKTDCKLNLALETAELKITPMDTYADILKAYDNQYNLPDLGAETAEIKFCKSVVEQVYVAGASTVSNYQNGACWETEVVNMPDGTYDDIAYTLMEQQHFGIFDIAHEIRITNAPEGFEHYIGTYAGTGRVLYNSDKSAFIYLFGRNMQIYERAADGSYFPTFYSPHELSPVIFLEIELPHGRPAVHFMPQKDNAYTEDEPFELHHGDSASPLKINIKGPDITEHLILTRLVCEDDILQYAGSLATLTSPIGPDDIVAGSTTYTRCVYYVPIASSIKPYCTAESTSTPTKYGKNDYGKFFTNQKLLEEVNKEAPTNYDMYTYPLPLCPSSWVNASLWYPALSGLIYNYFNKYLQTRVIKNCYNVGEVISALLKAMGSDIEHKPTPEFSEFLYSVPFGMGKLENWPYTFDVMIAQKTDALKPDSDSASQRAEISLADVLSMLRDCFRCYWFIEDGMLKIEHVSYFQNGRSYRDEDRKIQLYLSSKNDWFNKTRLDWYQTSIEYDKANFASRYEFSWVDDSSDVFSGLAIDLTAPYIKDAKIDSIRPGKFSADIDYMLQNPNSYSKDGFMLLCVETTCVSAMASRVFSVKAGQTIELSTLLMSAGTRTFALTDKARSIYLAAPAGKSTPAQTIKVEKDGFLYVNYRDIRLTPSAGPTAFSLSIDGFTYGRVALVFGQQYELYDKGHIAPLTPTIIDATRKITHTLPYVENCLIDENGFRYLSTPQNGLAAWPSLVNTYMYDMPCSDIKVSAGPSLAVEKIKPFMMQTVEFTLNGPLNPIDAVRTRIGDGQIQEASVNIDTRLVKLKLAHTPR